jgi:hypothetical protein
MHHTDDFQSNERNLTTIIQFSWMTIEYHAKAARNARLSAFICKHHPGILPSSERYALYWERLARAHETVLRELAEAIEIGW